jgi:hypothetical protein
VHAVGNMASVYNVCHSNQSTVERDVKQYGGRDVNKMADVRAGAGAKDTTWRVTSCHNSGQRDTV